MTIFVWKGDQWNKIKNNFEVLETEQNVEKLQAYLLFEDSNF